MPFSLANPVIPTSIDGMYIILYTNPRGSLPNGEQGLIQSVSYEVEIMSASGSRMRVSGDIGDLVPYLNSEQISWLLQFMSSIRALANNAFLNI